MIIREYFGASNSYGGFYSKFKDLFRRDKFRTLYIIKGGPGTGKSTLMKKIDEYCQARNIETERIYCSSDPKSLDGLIIHSSGGRIGIVDGTPPHTVEPKYPGAVELILNLGEGFNTDRLSQKRKAIEELTHQKSKAYKTAYSFLSMAGRIHDFVISKLSDIKIYSVAERILSNIELNTKGCSASCDDILIHSFSHYGLCHLEGLSTHPVIPSDGFVEEMIFKQISDLLRMQEVSHRLCLSPLSINGILGIETGSMILSTCDGDPMELYPHPFLSTDEYNDLNGIHKKLLQHAQRALIEASHAHFSLEDIYTDAMIFSIHDEIYGAITDKIDSLSNE